MCRRAECRIGIEVVETIEIGEVHSLAARVYEAVQGFLVNQLAASAAGHLMAEVFSERPFARFRVVRPTDFRKQKELHVRWREGEKDDERGALHGLAAMLVYIGDAFGAAIPMRDPADPAVIAQRESFFAPQQRHQHAGGLRLGPDHAAEKHAIATVGATGPGDAFGVRVILCQRGRG